MQPSVNLGELAFGCYMYGALSGESDGGYQGLLEKAGAELNLEELQNREWLLHWLNSWGCRQFKITDHPAASCELEDWNSKYSLRLFAREKRLLSLTDGDFAVVEDAFDDLAARKASTRKAGSGDGWPVRFGPVGAAKILFALRPNALPPWDTPIYTRFGWAGSGADYVEFLRWAVGSLSDLREECTSRNLEFEDLPARIGRPKSTLVKLIDEYLWVTITYKLPFPSREKLENWLEWSQA